MLNWHVAYNQDGYWTAYCRCGFESMPHSHVSAFRVLKSHYGVDNCTYTPDNVNSNSAKSLPETEENGYNVSPFID